MNENKNCFVGLEFYSNNFRGLISRVFKDYDSIKEYLISIGYYEKEKYRFESFSDVDKLIIVQYKIYINK